MAATQHTSQTWVHPDPDLHEDRHDFSLVLGGPLFQLLRKAHLEGDHLELLRQRMLVITGGAWLPLLLLSVLSTSDGSVGRLSFFHDVEVHVRFLIALPVLVAAEVIVHARIRPVVRRFIERRIVLPQDLPRFDRAIESAIRLRNSVLTELGLFLIVYTFGLLLWQSRVPILAPTWYALSGGRWHLTPAGYWYVFVSIPILQFILLRWYMRFIIWFRFLWQVSRLDLNLVSTHPDRCGGLAFLGKSAYAFGPILFAQGAMLAGVVAGRVLYRGESLPSFKLQIGGFIAFFVFAILGPLVMFTSGWLAQKERDCPNTACLLNATSRPSNKNGCCAMLLLPRNCSDLAIFNRSLILATAMRSYARCGRSHSESRTSRVARPPPPRLSCLSCSRFSLRKNSSCASLRSYFDEALLPAGVSEAVRARFCRFDHPTKPEAHLSSPWSL